LLQPQRDGNGYRNYSDADMQTLKLVKLLRSLDISIDDIKGVLHKEISFQDCLRVNDQKLTQTMTDLEDIKQTVTYLKEAKLPMIPALANIDTTSYPFTIGFKKTNASASLGRKLTPLLARKKWLGAILTSVIVDAAIVYGMASWTNIQPNPIFIILIGLIFFAILLVSGFQMQSFGFDMSKNQYIEFLEDGVRCYRYQGVLPNVKYLWYAALGKPETCLETYTYTDISQVKITENKRYMKIPASNLSTTMLNYDFMFTFKNGKSMYLYNPMTFDNDRLLVGTILLEYVSTIIDPDNVLHMFVNK
jgi:DNA-binding transcriptional MerR regulator